MKILPWRQSITIILSTLFMFTNPIYAFETPAKTINKRSPLKAIEAPAMTEKNYQRMSPTVNKKMVEIPKTGTGKYVLQGMPITVGGGQYTPGLLPHNQKMTKVGESSLIVVSGTVHATGAKTATGEAPEKILVSWASGGQDGLGGLEDIPPQVDDLFPGLPATCGVKEGRFAQMESFGKSYQFNNYFTFLFTETKQECWNYFKSLKSIVLPRPKAYSASTNSRFNVTGQWPRTFQLGTLQARDSNGD